ncbi:TonB-dependent siderophore receptor [Pseudoroseomonas globiformis]|uniref:TonB-dependent siderophore receptor n=1 Tax=Teichococcus globiformis TaxID=2307229 RepID=A0ABV7FVZ1_9PROT
MNKRLLLAATPSRLALLTGLTLAAFPAGAQEQPSGSAGAATLQLPMVDVVATAEQQLKQAPGVSIIDRQDIEREPPANDISELVRKMPGVNLTGNSSSGQYGNNRQIDLRGMGPENTLILIDGKPVRSRNSTRMGRSGERNTRGDSNWVPANAIDRIEVIRGPAAARYGSGAAGGVVNIITKPPTDTYTGSVSVYMNQPEDKDEGDTKRIGFTLAGPLWEAFSFRLFGNFARTDADSLSLNQPFAVDGGVPPAGREGVENRDLDGLLRWDLTPNQALEFEAGYSRQGNIYAGDRAVNEEGTALLEQLANEGAETNVLDRTSIALTHRGEWGGTESRLLLYYEGTQNKRLNEGLAGSGEGSINTNSARSTSVLNNYEINGDISIPIDFVVPQRLTMGAEYLKENLSDPFSVTQSTGLGGVPAGIDQNNRSGKDNAETYAAFVEDNVYVTERLTVTPGVRFDHHSKYGSNVSPSLNAAYEVFNGFSVKGGIAQAYKAPNLYQSNPNYLYYTMGFGCPIGFPSLGAGCYVQGNPDLKPETSLNKEIGVVYDQAGWNASVTYFHNDYKDKIQSGLVPVGQTAANGRVFRWENTPEAVVEGIEGNLLVPLMETLSWNTNLTYMIQSKDKTTGEPLSLIPEYTINSSLDWNATEQLFFRLGLTHYGKQEARTTNIQGTAATGTQLLERKPYSVVDVSATYDINASTRLTAGISNLLDEQLLRQAVSNGYGANSYNEPGRAYFVSLTAFF